MPARRSSFSSHPQKDHELQCPKSNCFQCLMKEPDENERAAGLMRFFKLLPNDPAGHGSSISAIWSIAMARPNDAELVELGVFQCMASLIWKGIQNRRWLLKDQNIFIPYYAAHIIGSYTMNRGDFAGKAVQEGVIPPLLHLLQGRLTWVEQRVAVRALGHIAAFEGTFQAVARHAGVLELAMELAVSSLDIVYMQFIRSEERRLKYHKELLTRGIRGPEIEASKAEEWASQLQCWCLQLINCFAAKENYLSIVCRPEFLSKVPGLWGGLMNENSPAGMGLLLTICHQKKGRSLVSACPAVVQKLCNTARSSDDWQYIAIDCLLLLLQDPHTCRRIFDDAVVPLVDLAVQPCLGERKKLGTVILDTLFLQDTQSPMRRHMSNQTRYLLDELAAQRQRLKWERSMSKDDLRVKQHAAHVVKLEGNAKFSAGDVVGAIHKYSEALSLCPLKATKERVVLHSNRAQCHLLLQDPETAISDATRALCLHKPLHGHGRSLWRRAQAYEMLGLSKESLLDAIMFINESSTANTGGAESAVPEYAARFVKKQMRATWLFLEAARMNGDLHEEGQEFELREANEYEEGDDSEWETASESDTTCFDETTDQGSCSKDEGESDFHSEKHIRENKMQKLISSFKGIDIQSKAYSEKGPLTELNEKERMNFPVDKELLKKRIYNLIQERRLLNDQQAEFTQLASKNL